MPNLRAAAVLLVVLLSGTRVDADPVPAPEGLLSLSASAQVDAPRDWLTVTVAATRDGAEPGVVQAQLTSALESALAIGRPVAQPGKIEVQTGTFAVQPRHGPKGEIATWVGRAELVLQGRDLAGIAQLAGRLNTMTVAGVAYTLSREARQRAEAEAAAQAIARYRALAAEYARLFGRAGYVLREVHVGTSEMSPPRPMPLAMRAAEAADAALPLEAGQGTVAVTVSGTVQLK